MRIEFRQERFAVDIDIGIDSEIFVPVDVSEFDDTSIVEKVGKTLLFDGSKLALLFISASQFGSVDSTETDGDVFPGNGRMLVDVTGEGIAVDDTQEAGRKEVRYVTADKICFRCHDKRKETI